MNQKIGQMGKLRVDSRLLLLLNFAINAISSTTYKLLNLLYVSVQLPRAAAASGLGSGQAAGAATSRGNSRHQEE